MYLHLFFRSKSSQYFFILSNSNLQLFILLYLYAKSFASILLFCIPKTIDISLEEKLSNSTSISIATHGDFPSELLLFKLILFNPSGFCNPPLPKKNFLSPVYDLPYFCWHLPNPQSHVQLPQILVRPLLLSLPL